MNFSDDLLDLRNRGFSHRHGPQEEDVVAVIGSSGSGKSSFINALTGENDLRDGYGLERETRDLKAIDISDYTDGHAIVILDLPGFDDWRGEITDTDILRMIADYLSNRYGPEKKLAGIVYLQRISDSRLGSHSSRNLRMLRALCGTNNYRNVVVLTTFWDQVPREEGLKREAQLQSTFFQDFRNGGAHFMRSDRSTKIAREAILYIVPLLKWRDLDIEEDVIVIMGSPGTGKTSFIGQLLGKTVPQPNNLGNFEVAVQLFEFYEPERGRKILILETPGFDNSVDGLTDMDVLKSIADFMQLRYDGTKALAGLIYIQRISDSRIGGFSSRNIRMLRHLCGTQDYQKIVILTTFWDRVDSRRGLECEAQLKSTFFRDLVTGGARFVRHNRTAERAKEVVLSFLTSPSRRDTQLQEEYPRRRPFPSPGILSPSPKPYGTSQEVPGNVPHQSSSPHDFARFAQDFAAANIHSGHGGSHGRGGDIGSHNNSNSNNITIVFVYGQQQGEGPVQLSLPKTSYS